MARADGWQAVLASTLRPTAFARRSATSLGVIQMTSHLLLVQNAEISKRKDAIESHILSGGFLSVDRRYSLRLDERGTLIATSYKFSSTPDYSSEMADLELKEAVEELKAIVAKLPKMRQVASTQGIEFCLNEDYGQGSFVWRSCDAAGNIQTVHPYHR